jgi:hypothetical protein
LNILGNGGLVSLEHVNEDGSAIELLSGLLKSGWVGDIAGVRASASAMVVVLPASVNSAW